MNKTDKNPYHLDIPGLGGGRQTNCITEFKEEVSAMQENKAGAEVAGSRGGAVIVNRMISKD